MVEENKKELDTTSEITIEILPKENKYQGFHTHMLEEVINSISYNTKSSQREFKMMVTEEGLKMFNQAMKDQLNKDLLGQKPEIEFKNGKTKF